MSRNPFTTAWILFCFLALSLVPASAQDNAAKCTPPQSDTSVIDPNGTAHVTRVVPVPDTVSPEAQKWLAEPRSDTEVPYDVAKDRAQADAWQANGGEQMRKVYPVNVAKESIAGVPVRIVTPLTIPAEKRNRVLINVHGGGFNADWGSLIETIPIANLTQTKVVAVLYSLAPEHPFPAAVDETVGVYKELLKTYKPQNIGLYGTSAGAILTAEVAARLRQLRLPLPAALGVFSGSGDMSKQGDSMAIYGLWGLSGPMSQWDGKHHHTSYSGATDLKDPILSPIYSDLTVFPQPCSSPASATCYSAAPSTCTGRTDMQGWTRSWWSSTVCHMPSGTIGICRSRKKHIGQWPASSIGSWASKRRKTLGRICRP